MANVINTDAVNFPDDVQKAAPYYQGTTQLSVLRVPVLVIGNGTGTLTPQTTGQLWPRGNRGG